MSRLAPNFSASVIGGNVCGFGDPSCVIFWDDTEVVPPFATASPKKDCFKARNVNAATSTMPAPVVQTASGYVFHVPIRIVISAANPLKPGMPIDAADAMTKEKAANGRARLRFMADKASSSRVWVRR